MRDLELERYKKTDQQIVDSLIRDTRENKFHWYSDDNYIFTKVFKIVDDTKLQIIFKISELDVEEEDYDYITREYYAEYFPNNSKEIILELYMKKNNKKEIKCKTIYASQLSLINLVDVVLPIVKEISKK